MYAQKIKTKKLTWGGVVLASTFPAGKSVSLTGSIALPHRPGEDELAEVHAGMLLEGTDRYDKRALQATLDAMGASLVFIPTNYRLQFSARVRTVHLRELMRLIVEILQHPTFPAGELAVLKKREEANLAMELQDTNAQAAIALSQLIYQPTHPNYRQRTRESLAALKKIDVKGLRAFHERLSAFDLVFSASGDITPASLFAVVDNEFKQLPRAPYKKPHLARATAPKPRTKSVFLEHKASIDYLAGLPVRITNEHHDYAALLLGVQVLGNRAGFTGRLMQTVREEEGLTYGVYSLLAGCTGRIDGYLYAWATFAPKLFAKGRAAVLREIKKLASQGATDEEVRAHARQFEARSRVTLSNSGALARAAHDVVVDGKPISYLDTFPQKILKLRTTEVNQALKKYLRPDLLSETAAGPVEK